MTSTLQQDTQVIPVNFAGAAIYSWPFTMTDVWGNDVSADVCVAAIVAQGASPVTSFGVPDVISRGVISVADYIAQNPGGPRPLDTLPPNALLHWVTIQMKIDNGLANGNYQLWGKMTDTAETTPLLAPFGIRVY